MTLEEFKKDVLIHWKDGNRWCYKTPKNEWSFEPTLTNKKNKAHEEMVIKSLYNKHLENDSGNQ